MNQRPTLPELPVAITNLAYPWLTWLAWNLEDRWRLFEVAWRQFGDAEAGWRMQRELAALRGWDGFGDADGSIGLLSGHIAASLAAALANTNDWNPELLQNARSAAGALIERDVWPWFGARWAKKELTPRKLANIPVIALARSAQLARVIQHPRRAALEQKTREVLSAWCRFRTGREHHTEGVSYDGYLFYTLGIWAHNPPVIGGVAQTQRRGELEQLATDAQGRQHAQVNLSKCYRGLPQTASVRRDLWLSNHGRRGLVVCDTLKGLAKGVEVSHGWQGGHHFAWAFRQGWARLSDGERALWIGTSPDGIAPGELKRHPGTRGPLTLVHSAVLPEGEGVRWWVFVCDPDAGSTAPSLKQAQAAMQVSGVGLSLDAWSFR